MTRAPAALAMLALAFATVSTLTTMGACGRSSADPCRAREGLGCSALAEERLLEQADFDVAIAARDGDTAGREGACVQALVAEQLERRCIPDACVELCALHPCAVRDAAGAPSANDCQARCDQVVADNAIARAALDEAIVRAADEPTLCTCSVCDEASEALCEQLWLCAL